MTETTGSHITADGVELFTRSWTIEAPRYDVLLVHGLGEHSGRWSHVGEFFNAHGANVYSYDLRGHGNSPGDRGHIADFDEFYSDISEMAYATAAATGRPWVLYGHSLGGLQCAGFLINDFEPHPNIAVLSAPAMAATRGIDNVLKVAASVLGTISPNLSVPSNITGDMLSRDASVGEAYFADELVETKATTRFGKVVYAEQAKLADRNDTVSTQTLVIHGADDELVQPSASAKLAGSDAVERRVYPGLRHEMHNEPESAQVLGDVTDWIDRKLFG
ncbi:MAG: alpha/beta fold hydrolase [Proteobacteria bacterium]|nr:alpha/beta fold hydrolase [Pseudomonadota bacterium]